MKLMFWKKAKPQSQGLHLVMVVFFYLMIMAFGFSVGVLYQNSTSLPEEAPVDLLQQLQQQ